MCALPGRFRPELCRGRVTRRNNLNAQATSARLEDGMNARKWLARPLRGGQEQGGREALAVALEACLARWLQALGCQLRQLKFLGFSQDWRA